MCRVIRRTEHMTEDVLLLRLLGRNHMYVFGGEFTSPSQMQFYHHKDMWRLDLMTMKWEELSMKGGPTPRSGHRAVAYKGSKIFVFGGFYDTGHDVRYFNDCYMYDTQVSRPPAC